MTNHIITTDVSSNVVKLLYNQQIFNIPYYIPKREKVILFKKIGYINWCYSNETYSYHMGVDPNYRVILLNVMHEIIPHITIGMVKNVCYKIELITSRPIKFDLCEYTFQEDIDKFKGLFWRYYSCKYQIVSIIPPSKKN